MAIRIGEKNVTESDLILVNGHYLVRNGDFGERTLNKYVDLYKYYHLLMYILQLK